MFLHAFWFAHEKPIACTAIVLPWLFVLNDTISTESSITVFLAALFWIRQKLIANFTNEAWLNRIDSMLFFQLSQLPKIFCPIFANFLNFIPIPLQFITLLLPAGFYPLIHIIQWWLHKSLVLKDWLRYICRSWFNFRIIGFEERRFRACTFLSFSRINRSWIISWISPKLMTIRKIKISN